MKMRQLSDSGRLFAGFFFFVSFLGAALEASAGPVGVASVVETPEAIFYDAGLGDQLGDPIRVVPKTEIRVLKYDGPQDPAATSSYWRVGVFFKKVLNRDLGNLDAQWNGRKLAQGFLTPSTECQLSSVEGIRSIVQEVKALGRDLSAGDEAAICQFRFRIPNDKLDSTLASLKKEAENGSLVKKSLILKFLVAQTASSVPWDPIQTSLRNYLAGREDDSLAKDEAVFLLGLAVSSDKTTANSITKWELDDLRAFVDGAFGNLFTTGDDGQLKLNSVKANGSFSVKPTSEEKTYDL